MHFKTKQIHAGAVHEKEYGSHNKPIYQTSTYIFEDCDQGARRFLGEEEGYFYSRIGDPNGDELARRMAQLDNTDAGLVCASGMAAISTVLIGLLKSGDHYISHSCVYGGTVGIYKDVLSKFDVSASFINLNDEVLYRKSFTSNTKLVYIETPANPTLELIDIEKVAKIAKEHDCIVVCDNTFLTPYIQKPIDLGADICVYSSTKYLNGHGDVVGGIITGKQELIDKIKIPAYIYLGTNSSPFDAWLVTRGLKTLSLRMEEHCKNALVVAKFLESHPKVNKVYYPGLESFEQHELAKSMLNGKYGGMISFEVTDGISGGKQLLDNLKIIGLGVSLGSVDSLIQHPASMTHVFVPKEMRENACISDGLVRISVGIEAVEDLIADLEQGLSFV